MRIKLIKYKKIYQWGCSCLIHTPLKQIAQILSHGGVHLLLFVALFFIIMKLFKLSTTEVGPQYHEVDINFKSSVQYIYISADISSDSTLSQTGYSQRIYIRYMPYKDTIEHEKSKLPYSTAINVSRYPHSAKWAFSDNIQTLDRQDTVFFKDYACKLYGKSDSTLNVEFYSGDTTYLYTPFPKLQHFSVYSDELLAPNSKGNNPYYYFFLRLGLDIDMKKIENSSSGIGIYFGDFARNGSNVRQNKALKIQYVFPEPDRVTNGAFLYHSSEAIQRVISNGGIIVQAEDIALKNKGDKESFIYAILLGAIIAFWIDVFVNLIIKLRNFNNRINI